MTEGAMTEIDRFAELKRIEAAARDAFADGRRAERSSEAAPREDLEDALAGR